MKDLWLIVLAAPLVFASRYQYASSAPVARQLQRRESTRIVCNGQLPIRLDHYPDGTNIDDYEGSLAVYCGSSPNGPNGKCTRGDAGIDYLDPLRPEDLDSVRRHWASRAMGNCMSSCGCEDTDDESSDSDETDYDDEMKDPNYEMDDDTSTWRDWERLERGVRDAMNKDASTTPWDALLSAVSEISDSGTSKILDVTLNQTQLDDMQLACNQPSWPDASQIPTAIDSTRYGNNLTEFCTKPDGLGGRCYRGRPDFRALEPSHLWAPLLGDNATKACSSCSCQLTLTELRGHKGTVIISGPKANLTAVVEAVQELEKQIFNQTIDVRKLEDMTQSPPIKATRLPPSSPQVAQDACPVAGAKCHAHRQCVGSALVKGCGCNYDAGYVDPVTRARVGICGSLHLSSGLNVRKRKRGSYRTKE